MTDQGDSPVTRRRMLTGLAGAAGVAALAGCASEETQQSANTAIEAAAMDVPQPPSRTPDNEYWAYVVRSLHYQNQQAHAQTQGIAALIRDSGLNSGGGSDDGG